MKPAPMLFPIASPVQCSQSPEQRVSFLLIGCLAFGLSPAGAEFLVIAESDFRLPGSLITERSWRFLRVNPFPRPNFSRRS